jgi:2-oxoglutarate dehydrogenase E1 component
MHVPIFHVNGDRPEHVIRAIDLAFQFRQKFGYDAVVDIICYRQFGHNESDEPSFTHPLMYKAIKNHSSVTTLYGTALEESGEVSKQERDQMRLTCRERLQEALEKAKKGLSGDILNDAYQTGEWKEFDSCYSFEPVRTGFPETKLKRIARALTEIPDGFAIHPKLKRIVTDRAARLKKGEGIDWATAEALAFGSLLLEGTPIRLSGEDSGRGTFSQRHAVWWDSSAEYPKPHIPLNHIDPKQARFSVYDSPLSEFSILGFEYGYALNQPKTLTLWEAQFGDFANGAQVIIDNFLASGESKWFRSNGLVMLLPHGFEGQGPEHSSAHLERYLQLCAENNLQVCYPSSPAQYFHVLRRQMRRSFRKPLIVMTPKSLLRHPLAASTLEDLAKGTFREVLWDPHRSPESSKLILCSGKVYYDLYQRREEGARKDSPALVRIEQLYPFPEGEIREVLETYSDAKDVFWVQEEPQNRGAWSFVQPRIESLLNRKLRYVGREASASPATGSHAQHKAELESILEQVFGKIKVKA